MDEELQKILKHLRLGGLLAHWDKLLAEARRGRFSHERLLKHVLQAEYRVKIEQGQLLRRERAHIPELLEIETFPFARQPKLDRKRIMSLYDRFDYVTKQQNIVWLGADRLRQERPGHRLPVTAAFSADPERKYRAGVSTEACPSRAWTWAGSAPPWRRRVAKECRQRWGRRPGMPASAPTTSTTWVMPEMVSRPRCPCQAGRGWRPRSSSQAETRSRARLDSGTERTSSPLPCRRTSPVRAVIAKSSASSRAHSSGSP